MMFLGMKISEMKLFGIIQRCGAIIKTLQDKHDHILFYSKAKIILLMINERTDKSKANKGKRYSNGKWI
jgi:hypothetical protein